VISLSLCRRSAKRSASRAAPRAPAISRVASYAANNCVAAMERPSVQSNRSAAAASSVNDASASRMAPCEIDSSPRMYIAFIGARGSSASPISDDDHR
jgi:hypothetical protein